MDAVCGCPSITLKRQYPPLEDHSSEPSGRQESRRADVPLYHEHFVSCKRVQRTPLGLLVAQDGVGRLESSRDVPRGQVSSESEGESGVVRPHFCRNWCSCRLSKVASTPLESIGSGGEPRLEIRRSVPLSRLPDMLSRKALPPSEASRGSRGELYPSRRRLWNSGLG